MNNLNPLIEQLQNIKPSPLKSFMVANFLENVESFYQRQPFFYDRSGQFWVWDIDKKRYVETDEIDLMIALENGYNLSGQTISSSIKGQYLEAFKRVGRKNIPKDLDINFIQFKSFLYDIKTDMTSAVTPDYFLTNPIPWDIGESEETPIMDKLFEEWVGFENKKTLYEIIAYCLYRGYPIHSIFALVGAGRNGKSQYQKVILKFLGAENVSSTDLDILLDNRFESIKLYKKLAAQMGETNFGVMKKTSLLKKLSGGDLIGYERKNQKPFDDYNYAKILINSNALPSSYDTSEGFYRRWFIVDFPNSFDEGQEVYLKIPDVEYSNLCLKCVSLLKDLLIKGHFSSQGSIEERRTKYIQHSNPFGLFLEQSFDRDHEGFISYGKLFIMYRNYLTKNKKRLVSWKEMQNSLADEGLEVRKTSKDINGNYISDRWVEGIKEKNVTIMTFMTDISLNSFREGGEQEKQSQKSQKSQKEEDRELIINIINQKTEKHNALEVDDLIQQLDLNWLFAEMKKEGIIFESPVGHYQINK